MTPAENRNIRNKLFSAILAVVFMIRYYILILNFLLCHFATALIPRLYFVRRGCFDLRDLFGKNKIFQTQISLLNVLYSQKGKVL